ncbi:diguanylate cyclase [Clostridium botulinum]|uniref:Diguanylate cyclase n=3 Tax=Clostridium botulinum TaxID=1491 RepID=A0A9Q1UXQ8_CLOBO|nr:EAL domain-containing protein [Clostridium botulinum]KEI04285.1 diguanylate cyclase [Clostridium botulinum C/D str. Sp77]KOA77294.1 diguanylate cyclase [Clostridium botulinum]KOA84947.1 diguanylate cyclase [Clostridium botulinum]KOA85492.1 diguanylate cyclase [Clostridium botulinum]KOA85786.1 diguanylate cyclase [Clostridium botulinum]
MKYLLFMILFISSIIYFLTGIYILKKDRKSSTNKTFFLLCTVTCCWAFGYCMMLITEDIYCVNIFRIISSVGWCFIHGTLLEFAIAISCGGKKEISYIKKIILYIFPLIFFIRNAMNSPHDVIVKTNMGFVDICPIDLIFVFLVVYYMFCVLCGIFIIHKWGKNSNKNREKKQAVVLNITIIIAFVLGTLTNVILPIYKINTFPWGIFFTYIPIFGMWYSIITYKMLSITPAYVSDYIFKSVNEPIFFLEQDLIIKNANKAAISMSKYNIVELQQKSFNTLIKESKIDLNKLLKKNYMNNLEVNLVSKDNKSTECILSARIVYDDFKDILGIVIILYDISERKNAEKTLRNYNIRLVKKVKQRTLKLEESNKILQKEILDRKIAEEKIRYMLYNDELTKLPNRLYFRNYINEMLIKYKKNCGYFAIMFLGIDNFKLVNDTLGHNKGDELIKQFSNRIKEVIDDKYLFARGGGDEFLLLINNMDKEEDTDTIKKILSNINKVLKNPFIIENEEQFITISVGVAFYPDDGQDEETLLKSADTAMYEAKSCGKNDLKCFSLEVRKRLIEKTIMKNNLYRALEREELEIYYQPQVDILKNKIVGFEALLRWKFNDEQISPNKFIPIAEDTGLIVSIGYMVIKEACRTVKKWNNITKEKFTMAINISFKQLYEPNFVKKVKCILREIELDAEYIEFEITERVAIKQNKDVFNTIQELKKMGIKISIDDFGTEYSSFMNIKKISIDKIKIDMQFIKNVPHEKKDSAIVSSIIDFSHNLGLKVIAEGVETKEQLEYLTYKKCDEVQGFLYYKPKPSYEIEKIIKNIIENK